MSVVTLLRKPRSWETTTSVFFHRIRYSSSHSTAHTQPLRRDYALFHLNWARTGQGCHPTPRPIAQRDLVLQTRWFGQCSFGLKTQFEQNLAAAVPHNEQDGPAALVPTRLHNPIDVCVTHRRAGPDGWWAHPAAARWVPHTKHGLS